ncbi:hypothetical protein [Rheinheimera sp. MMS21-TC3]|uniref:hypothetical protein n=1 Tax=Rheinheimera sp. MMS21-TC3 TaxID=3072790 RepID=UPI0028C3CA01|nr:hypothetical protein [Rheinheimera sp. MMS21-TC3]WNO59414.1 hypothetical protein RDV63_00155 [Rheinheimera sp. MMS21-TC3]WNO62251.1 hypothetical protein RDV63_15210 [Rheinheimera sp. MMS21-TC3]
MLDTTNEKQTDDSLAYENSQTELKAADPLATIKDMRLQQLAVCRLKTAEELQAMRLASVSAETKT